MISESLIPSPFGEKTLGINTFPLRLIFKSKILMESQPSMVVKNAS